LRQGREKRLIKKGKVQDEFLSPEKEKRISTRVKQTNSKDGPLKHFVGERGGKGEVKKGEPSRGGIGPGK